MLDITDITREHIDNHVHPKLRRRVLLYLIISICISIAAIYRLAVYRTEIIYPLIAVVLGLGIGILFSRMFHISWDDECQEVISHMDAYGVLVLLGYIAFELVGEHYIKGSFTGYEVVTIILSLSAGTVLGRGLGMSGRMLRILKENI